MDQSNDGNRRKARGDRIYGGYLPVKWGISSASVGVMKQDGGVLKGICGLKGEYCWVKGGLNWA